MQDTTNIDYKALYEEAQVRYEEALGTITELKFRIDQLEKLVFGSKHERFVPTNLPTAQLALDLKAEEVATCSVIDTRNISYAKTTVAVEKNPDKHGRSKLPPHLRREEIYIDPPNLPEGSIKIGQEVTEQLECTRSEIYVKRYIRFRYLVPGQPLDEKTKIVIAELPAQPVDKCMAGPSMLATILIDKFLYHLPAYRQMQRFEYSAVPIAYSTLIAWIALACNLLEVLFEALKQEILKCGYLHADETGIKVLDQSKNGKKIHNGFFWVYNNSIDKLVFFDYQPTRSKLAPQGILANFKGYLQTDGYDGYDNFDKNDHIIHLHCMAHSRRYFFDSLPTDRKRSEYVLEQIRQLYAIERSCKEKNLSFDERKEIRQEKSVPILNKLGEWMTEQYALVLPKSPIGKALAYSIKRWDMLCRYTTDGKLSLDNNPVENSLRPVALGRKNFLFCGSQNAAPRAAMMYSLIGTCKLQGIDPYIWLKDVLTRLPMHHINKIKELLPHNWKKLQVPNSNDM